MPKRKKPKTTEQLIRESEQIRAKARRNLRQAEQLVLECWEILGVSDDSKTSPCR
jgi:hypothetical protein